MYKKCTFNIPSHLTLCDLEGQNQGHLKLNKSNDTEKISATATISICQWALHLLECLCLKFKDAMSQSQNYHQYYISGTWMLSRCQDAEKQIAACSEETVKLLENCNGRLLVIIFLHFMILRAISLYPLL